MAEFKLSLNEDVVIMPVLPHMPIPLNLWHSWGIGKAIEINILPGKMLLNEVKAIIKYLIISGVGIEGISVPVQQLITHPIIKFLPSYLDWLYILIIANIS